MRSRLRTWPKLFILALVMGGFYVGLRYQERRMIYLPEATMETTPAKIDLPYEEVVILPADGLDVYGWYIPPREDREPTGAALLFFRGYQGNMSDELPRLKALHQYGVETFIIDYRGYGKSGGAPSEYGLGLDALAAYFYLVGERGVPYQHVFLYGESLGAAVAIELATKVRAAGLITNGALISTTDRMERAYPFIPWRILFRDRYECLPKITQVHMPILLVHREADEIAPVSHSRRLHAAARAPKELLTIDQALSKKHQDAYGVDMPIGKMVTFMEEQMKRVDPPVTSHPSAQASSSHAP